ncbi:hypothetical protein B0H14DRAFT_3497737 [Mycena olivaceomarginata]|nr:hypothetical protein B0H14DRAFT_3497737 [Mycena olivaceomarginata]
MARLLDVLDDDREISTGNWQAAFPKQYNQRAPPNLSIRPASHDDPSLSPADLRAHLEDWVDLPMLAKLDLIHLLTEALFHNPTRIRSLMKSDDKAATWVRVILLLPKFLLTWIVLNRLATTPNPTFIGLLAATAYGSKELSLPRRQC